MAEENPNPASDVQIANLQTRLQTAGLINTGKQADISKHAAEAGLAAGSYYIFKGKHYILIIDR